MSDSDKVLSQVLRDSIARLDGSRPALIGADWSLTYSDLANLIDRYAGGFRAWVKVPGTLIGIRTAKRAKAIAAFLGAMQCGLCPAFLDPRLAVGSFTALLAAVGIKHLVIDEESAISPAALRKLGLEVRRLDDLLASTGYQSEELHPDDAAMMLFTSGSTGLPKGILLSHSNLLCNAEGIVDRTDIESDDRLLHVMPHYHTNGINNQLIAPLLAGAAIVLVEKFRSEALVSQIHGFTVTYMTGVPTMYSRILASSPVPQRQSSLRFLRCGSAPISTALHERVEEAFGVPLSVSYGLSEATCTSTMNPPFSRRVGTVGPALRNQTVKLLAPGSEREVPPGEEGEVCIAGAALMKGYVEAGVRRTLTAPLLRTGDLGSFDSDGYLCISGRIKDIIVRAGENLSPRMIEHVLALHPAVQACAVVGMEDGDLGEVPIAFVVSRKGRRITEQTLSDHVRDRLSHAYVPAQYMFLDDVPENAVGKTDHQVLRKWARAAR